MKDIENKMIIRDFPEKYNLNIYNMYESWGRYGTGDGNANLNPYGDMNGNGSGVGKAFLPNIKYGDGFGGKYIFKENNNGDINICLNYVYMGVKFKEYGFINGNGESRVE
jgi:hypothetical protein